MQNLHPSGVRLSNHIRPGALICLCTSNHVRPAVRPPVSRPDEAVNGWTSSGRAERQTGGRKAQPNLIGAGRAGVNVIESQPAAR